MKKKMTIISGLIFQSKIKAANMPENVIIYAEYRFNNFLVYSSRLPMTHVTLFSLFHFVSNLSCHTRN
jgi:hypothetical protein